MVPDALDEGHAGPACDVLQGPGARGRLVAVRLDLESALAGQQRELVLGAVRERHRLAVDSGEAAVLEDEVVGVRDADDTLPVVAVASDLVARITLNVHDTDLAEGGVAGRVNEAIIKDLHRDLGNTITKTNNLNLTLNNT